MRFFLELSVRLDQLCNLLIHSEPPIQIFIFFFFFKVALRIPQPVSFFVVTKADRKSHSLPFKGPEEDGEGKWEVTANPVKELKAFSPLKRTNSNTEGCSLRNTCFYFVPDCLWQDLGKHLVLYNEGLQRGDIRKRTDCI